MREFNFSVFIGRFQPFHKAHYQLLKKALEIAETAIVVIGSHNKPINTKNPWTSEERSLMIRENLSSEEQDRVKIIFMRDSLYNDNVWITSLQEKIKAITKGDNNIALVGCDYDKSSYYLRLFPQWESVLVKNLPYNLRATQIRDSIFSSNSTWKSHVCQPTADIVDRFITGETYNRLKEEYEFLQEYKNAWSKAPFPPTFITSDAVVIKSGHVLVVRRGSKLGKNLIALPGGFVDQYEKIEDGMLRELKEETRIKISKEVLRGHIKDYQVFDHPERSLRGRTITHAYLIDLGPGDLPKVKGSSDADKAWWMPLGEFMARESEFFEDHWHIISRLILKY